jgi:hypothetical protein
MNISLKSLSIPQLYAIRSVLVAGAEAVATHSKELAELRTYRKDNEMKMKRLELIKARQKRLDAAGLDYDVEAEADHWLAYDDKTFEFVVRKLIEQKLDLATASRKVMRIPPIISGNGHDDFDAKEIVREGFNELRGRQN